MAKKPMNIEPRTNRRTTKTTPTTWPRNTVASIETRKRDLVIRIANWTRQSARTGEPAYDVEVYDRGVYDWNESRTFTLWTPAGPNTRSKAEAKRMAVEFAGAQIRKLLR
jgi:hypothetical protein